jgi:hypothetical protein
MKCCKGLSVADRAARSRLHKLLNEADGLLHASLIRMSRRCGYAHCRCATKDQKHQSWYCGVTQKRKTRMKHIAKDQEATIRRWRQSYQHARRLLEQISQEAWKRLAASKK